MSILKELLLAVKIGTAVQIQNIGDSCSPHPLLIRLDAHTYCQIEDMQQEREQLTMN